jgi:hypothetical protein
VWAPDPHLALVDLVDLRQRPIVRVTPGWRTRGNSSSSTHERGHYKTDTTELTPSRRPCGRPTPNAQPSSAQPRSPIQQLHPESHHDLHHYLTSEAATPSSASGAASGGACVIPTTTSPSPRQPPKHPPTKFNFLLTPSLLHHPPPMCDRVTEYDGGHYLLASRPPPLPIPPRFRRPPPLSPVEGPRPGALMIMMTMVVVVVIRGVMMMMMMMMLLLLIAPVEGPGPGSRVPAAARRRAGAAATAPRTRTTPDDDNTPGQPGTQSDERARRGCRGKGTPKSSFNCNRSGMGGRPSGGGKLSTSCSTTLPKLHAHAAPGLLPNHQQLPGTKSDVSPIAPVRRAAAPAGAAVAAAGGAAAAALAAAVTPGAATRGAAAAAATPATGPEMRTRQGMTP